MQAVQETDLRFTFEVEDFETAIGGGSDDDSRADHGRGGGAGADGAAAFAMGSMEQQAALVEVDRAFSRVEGEDGVGAHAREGPIVGDHFSARAGAGAHDVGHFEDIIYFGGVAGIGRNDFDTVDDLGEPGLF